jgi:maltodextrin utilization protein YvdJ
MQDEFSQQLEQFSLVVDDLEQQLNARLAAEQAAAAVAVTPSLVPLAVQYTEDFAAPDSSLSEDTDTDTDSVLASKHYKTRYTDQILWLICLFCVYTVRGSVVVKVYSSTYIDT